MPYFVCLACIPLVYRYGVLPCLYTAMAYVLSLRLSFSFFSFSSSLAICLPSCTVFTWPWLGYADQTNGLKASKRLVPKKRCWWRSMGVGSRRGQVTPLSPTANVTSTYMLSVFHSLLLTCYSRRRSRKHHTTWGSVTISGYSFCCSVPQVLDSVH